MPAGWAGRCPREAPAPATLASLHEDAGRLDVRLSGVFLGEPAGMLRPFLFIYSGICIVRRAHIDVCTPVRFPRTL